MSELTRPIIGAVGEEVVQEISAYQDEEGTLATGNVLRRTCRLYGEGACKAVCQLRSEWELYDEDTTARELVSDAVKERGCSDINLLRALESRGLKPEETLMIGVTDNYVGFADRLDEYENLVENPYGWRELPGCNAFFARKGEVGALGRRLADCADINFEFKDKDGNTVFGFEHGTRTNLRGSTTQQAFEEGGEPMTFTEFTLKKAIEHYGADPAGIKIKLAAAIKDENFAGKHFDSEEKLEKHMPGWFADGYAHNLTNPSWRPGDPVVTTDEWQGDFRRMVIDNIEAAMMAFGIPAENFDKSGVIDPNESWGIYSSHESSKITGVDSRDLYISYPNQEKTAPTREELVATRVAELKKEYREVTSRQVKIMDELRQLDADNRGMAVQVEHADGSITIREPSGEEWTRYSSTSGLWYDGPDDLVGMYSE